MPKDKMEDVLYDIQLAQATFQSGSFEIRTNEQREAVLNGIFEKHGITKEILDSSLVWYADRMDVLVKITDGVSARLEEKEKYYSELKQEESQQQGVKQTDFPLYYFLTPTNPVYTFNFDSAKIAGMNIPKVNAVTFGVLGVSPDVLLTASFTMEYSDTVVVSSDTLKSSTISITIDQLTGKQMKNLSGFIYASDSLRQNYNILLHNIRLKKDSLQLERSVDPILKPMQLSHNE